MGFLTRMYDKMLGVGHPLALGYRGPCRGDSGRNHHSEQRHRIRVLAALDEGAIWVRGTLAPSTGQSQGIAIANQARILLCSFPEVPQCTKPSGPSRRRNRHNRLLQHRILRGSKAKEEWRPVFHQNKDELIAGMNKELEKIPGVVWNFSQPISDNMEEAVSGVKGELAVKLYGTDLRTLEATAEQIMNVMRGVKGVEDLGLFRVIGQPNLNFTVDRGQGRPLPGQRRGRAGCDSNRGRRQRADAGPSRRAALRPGAAVSSAVPRHERGDREYSPAVAQRGARLAGAASRRCRWWTARRKSTGRAASATSPSSMACAGAISAAPCKRPFKKVTARVKLPVGYTINWAGEFASQQRAQRRLMLIIPLTLLLIFFILYTMFNSMKWAGLVLMNVAMAPVGGLLALLWTGTNFSVSSGVGFLALFGVSVQTGVIRWST